MAQISIRPDNTSDLWRVEALDAYAIKDDLKALGFRYSDGAWTWFAAPVTALDMAIRLIEMGCVVTANSRPQTVASLTAVRAKLAA